MLKFPNVEKLDNKANKDLLNKIRDETCTIEDINATFNCIRQDRAKNSPIWKDEYNYLLLTIRKLKQRGCNVKRLERAFNKQKKKMGF
jgi:hypothetical protein